MSQTTAEHDDPFEIDPLYEQLFSDVDEDTFQSIKASIKRYGVDQPILVDADKKVIDGHHRLRAVRELRAEGHDVPDIPFNQKPTRKDTLRARRANLSGRDVDKKEGVKVYLHEHLPEPPEAADTDAEVMWPEDDEVWSHRNVAIELGVGKGTVHRAIEDSIQVVQADHLNIPSEREQKRSAVKSYIGDNPDATDQEVTDAVDWDISQPTVNRWRNEWFDDEDDDQETLEQSSLLGSGDDLETTSDVAQDAADGEDTATETLRDEQTTTADRAVETREEKQKEQDIAEDEQRREQQREQFATAVESSDAVDIHHGDFGDVLAEYDDESIDHIVTDPPYGEDYLPVWDALGEVAARVLKPGGFLVAYSGQYLLPQVMNMLSEHLEYYWQFVTLDDEPTFFIKKRIGIRYKPVVVFCKPPAEPFDKQAHDVIAAGDREKEHHEWEQPVEKAAALVTAVSEPNDCICDPMCGSGTTGVAALSEHRRAVLVDHDEEAVRTARERLSEVVSDV